MPMPSPLPGALHFMVRVPPSVSLVASSFIVKPSSFSVPVTLLESF